MLSLTRFLLGNYIPGLDFDPSGEFVATVDTGNVCVVRDINTGNAGFHLEFNEVPGNQFPNS